MSKMFFIPGMRPGHVRGAVGSTARPRKVERLVSGGSYHGKATPSNLVPLSDLDKVSRNTETKARKEREARARDVADALDMVKHQPNTARERLNETYSKAAEVAVDD